jgi:hypothetical protein
MLLRLITVIALFQFMLLMISGVNADVALYRSILVFTILFTVVYLTMFFLNIIRNDTNSEGSAVTEGNGSHSTEES